MPIYDQTFRRYEGPRRLRFLWWPVARQVIKPVLKSKLTWFILSGIVVPVLVVSIGFFISAKLEKVAPEHVEAAAQAIEVTDIPIFSRNRALNPILFTFLMGEYAFLWVFTLAAGGNTVSVEKRSNAFALYFARPLGPWEYIAGKVIGLTLLPSAVLMISLVVLYVQAWAYFLTVSQALALLPLLGRALLFVLVASLVTSLSMTACSGIAPSARAAGLLYLGFWMLASIVGNFLRHQGPWSSMRSLSPAHAMHALAVALINPGEKFLKKHREFADLDLDLAVVSLVVTCIVFFLLLRRSLRVVEVSR